MMLMLTILLLMETVPIIVIMFVMLIRRVDHNSLVPIIPPFAHVCSRMASIEMNQGILFTHSYAMADCNFFLDNIL